MAEEISINYNTVFSLKIMCITKTVVQLWRHREFKEKITAHLSEYNYKDDNVRDDRDEKFLQISEEVAENLHTLPLPNLLKENTKGTILLVEREIAKWINSFEEDFWDGNSKLEHIDRICFTNEGTVDKAKTIELHLDNPKIDHIFERACYYCLEEHIIRNLWEKMAKEKQDIYIKNLFKGGYKNHLRAYWICLLKNELYTLMPNIQAADFRRMYRSGCSNHLNMFVLSISQDNPLAAKYFWAMLTHEEKQKYIIKFANKHLSAEKKRHSIAPPYLMCFLLSKMSKQQQLEVFNKHSETVLESLFLHFPWRELFFLTIQSHWRYLDANVYVSILGTVLCEIEESCTGIFFKEVWSKSPMNLKKHFMKDLIEQGLINSLWNLFEIKDIYSINAILNDADIDEKKQIIFSTVKSGKLFDFICTGKQFLLQTLISNGMLSNEEIKNLKENIAAKVGDKCCCDWIYDHKWQAVEEFLNWCFDSQEEIATFKIEVGERIKEGKFLEKWSAGPWSAFESFINWCFNSDDKQINDFKVSITTYDKMEFIIFDLIMNCNIEFADKFLVWCFPSEKKMEEFKKEFLLSEICVEEEFLILDAEYKNGRPKLIKIVKRDFIEQLIDFFRPFQIDVFDQLKDVYRDLKDRNAIVESDANVESFFVP